MDSAQASFCETNCSSLYSSVPNTEFWCPEASDTEPWILLDLGHLYHVTGIDVRVPFGDGTVESISLEGSTDGHSWLSREYSSLAKRVR